MLSTAKAEATARDLKEVLEKRGFTVVETIEPKGRKLTIDTDKISIKIEAEDGVSKDIFGRDNDSFTPHDVQLAIATGPTTHSEAAKVMIDLAKYGFDLKIGEDAALAGAETAAGLADAERHSVGWPKKGA